VAFIATTPPTVVARTAAPANRLVPFIVPPP
jgi:hypothetical protein